MRISDWSSDVCSSDPFTRSGLEEYVSDCVILLDHRVHNQVSPRRLRIVKYRGTAHGTNEYPFLIDADGFSVLPVSAITLNHRSEESPVGNECVSTCRSRWSTYN